MIEVRHPATWLPERDYVLRVLLEVWLGLDIHLVAEPRSDTCISRTGGVGRVVLSDGSFSRPERDATLSSSSFRVPLRTWRISDRGLSEGLTADVLPLLQTTDAEHPVHVFDGEVALNFDLLGAVFHALTRSEELDDPPHDRHGRFPLEASLAWRGGFYQRPLADEYCLVLAWALRTAGVIDAMPPSPGYRVRLTHDVDRPVSALEGGMRSLARRAGADVILRRDIRLARSRVTSYRRSRRGAPAGDPSFCFDFLMDIAEEAGRQATFNVLARARDQTGPAPTSPFDASYRLTDGFMAVLIRGILERGHAIGLHGSYNSSTSPEQLAIEMADLRAAVEREGFDPGAVGGRQHYLRWRPETWRHLVSAGVSSDSSVGYAEGPGFRSGTCRPYPVFDVTRRTPLPLTEHPLIVMDVTLDTAAIRAGLVDRVASQVERTVSACRRMGGELVLLWHNTSVVGDRGRTLYSELVRMTGASGG